MRMTTVCGERGQFGTQHDPHAFYSTEIWPGLMVADQHQPAAPDQRGGRFHNQRYAPQFAAEEPPGQPLRLFHALSTT